MATKIIKNLGLYLFLLIMGNSLPVEQQQNKCLVISVGCIGKVILRVEPTVAMKIIRTKIIENLTKNYPKVAT